MGFASLALLTLVVKSSVGLRWEPESDLADTLALIDVDICQGIQVRNNLDNTINNTLTLLFP
jgi:hypothetical protein